MLDLPEHDLRAVLAYQTAYLRIHFNRVTALQAVAASSIAFDDDEKMCYIIK
jgi:hypothetical protein